MYGDKGNLLIKLSRIAVGMTRQELADACGRSARFIQRVENGDGPAVLTPEILKSISHAIRIPEEVISHFSMSRGGR